MEYRNGAGCDLRSGFMGDSCAACGADNFGGRAYCASAGERRLRTGAGPELRPEAPRLIGLSGLIGSGKSSTAEILAGWGFVRLEFAAPLKAAVRAILRADGLGEAEAEALITGAKKGAPSRTFCNQNMRYVRQCLGTEWGRDLIGADLWAGIAARRIASELARGRRVVVEDVRFDNEAAILRAACSSAEIWRLTGRGGAAGQAAAHCSEGLEIEDPDLILHNSAGLEDLEARVLEYVLG